MMEIAVIYNTDKVFVKFTQEVFKQLLIDYTNKEGSVEKAFERIVDELKKQTQLT